MIKDTESEDSEAKTRREIEKYGYLDLINQWNMLDKVEEPAESEYNLKK